MTNTKRSVVAGASVALVLAIGTVIPAFASSASTRQPQAVAMKAKTTTEKISGTYSGKMSFLVKNTTVEASSVTGSGTTTVIGKSTLTGTGSSVVSPTSGCDPISGGGMLDGAKGDLKLTVVTSSSNGCAAVAPPTTVTITGVVKVVSGTGVLKGATGTLSFKGKFVLLSDSSDSSTTFTNATLSGSLKVPVVTK